MTTAPCRRRTGEAVPRAEKLRDLITADHKVLDEDCESRNSQRSAVVVQDLVSQLIQSCPCKTTTSRETEKSLQKFLEPREKPNVIYTDNSLEFCKSCEDLSWNHRTSTPHRSETDGIAERAVGRVKEGTSAVLLQSGLDVEWWTAFFGCQCYLRNVHDLLADGGEKLGKGDILVADIEDLEKMEASEIYPRRINTKEVLITPKREGCIFPAADGTAKLSGRDYEFREPTNVDVMQEKRI